MARTDSIDHTFSTVQSDQQQQLQMGKRKTYSLDTQSSVFQLRDALAGVLKQQKNITVQKLGQVVMATMALMTPHWMLQF